MTKYILTDKNILYDNSYGNIPYFADITARDNYVENYLLSDWKNKLSARPKLGRKIETPLNDSINVQGTFEEVMNKNYMIIEKDDKYYFYFITGILNNNNNNFDLTIEKDLIMTYPTIINMVNKVKLTQSHLNNYYGYNFDGGSKEILNVSDFPYKVNDNEVLNQIRNKGWLIVFEQVNDESKYIPKISKGNDYLEPYKIYIAPLTPLQVKEAEADEDILYEQNNPNKYDMRNTLDSTTITLGLNKPINVSESLNVFYSMINISNNTFNYSFSLSDYEINEEQFVLFPVTGDASLALSVTKQIRQNGVYNDEIRLNDPLYVYYLPMFISYNGLNFTIRFTTINEFLEYIPNATKGRSTSEYYDEYWEAVNQGYGDNYGLLMDVSMYIAFNKISQTTVGYWSSDSLFDFLEDPDENSKVITAKTTNFLPIDTTQSEGVFSIAETNNIIYDEDNSIYYLSNLNYDRLLPENIYSLDVSQYSKYDLIEGINKFSLAIENQKEFSLNPNFITPNKTIEFQHYASFTPSWEERFKYINGNYVSLTNADNSFVNNKEFIKGTDILAQYKVNNPVLSKLEYLKPFTNAGNIATTLLSTSKKISIQKSKNYIDNLEKAFTKHALNRSLNGDGSTRGINQSITKNLVGKRSESFNWGRGLTSLLPIAGDFAGVFVNRANMKRQPDEFTGNGDINGDLIFNNNGIKFSLLEYGFLTPERDSIIEDIKRYGVTTNVYIDNLLDPNIKQKSFNYYAITELDNSNTNDIIQLLSDEEYTRFAGILENGVRIWWDITKWKDFDSND